MAVDLCRDFTGPCVATAVITFGLFPKVTQRPSIWMWLILKFLACDLILANHSYLRKKGPGESPSRIGNGEDARTARCRKPATWIVANASVACELLSAGIYSCSTDRRLLECSLNQTYSPSLTQQLQSFSEGDREIAEIVLREVMPKLHQIAVRELHRERYVAPLSPTELINEVWLRSLGKGGWQINSREHFYAIAALAMRRVLIDFARQRLALRRGDNQQVVSLDDAAAIPGNSPDFESILQIGALMDQLEKTNRNAARVVDLHYFAGFTLGETAKITGLSFRQVRQLWDKGRDWLKDHMASPKLASSDAG